MNSSMVPVLKSLFPLVPKQENRRLALLLFLTLLASLSELALAGLVALLAAVFGAPEAVLNNEYVAWFMDRSGITFGNDFRILALVVLCGVLGAVVWKNILAVFQQWQTAKFSEAVGAAAKRRIFRFYQRMPYLRIEQLGPAELNFGLSAAGQLAGALSVFLQAFTGVVLLIALVVGLVGVAPLPSLLFTTALALSGALVVKGLRRTIDRSAARAYTDDHAMNQAAHLAIHGLKEVRLYRRESALFSVFQSRQAAFVRAKSKLLALYRVPVASLESMGFVTLVGIMLFLIFVQDAGMARISGIMGFMAAAAWRGLPMANRLMDSLTQARGSLPYLKKAAELLEEERRIEAELLPLDERQPAPLPFEHNIVLDDVVFRYPGAPRPAVDGVSMAIPAGSMVGIVGLSGAGKSTLVNLLTGLLPPESGQVLVDGTPVCKENVAAWLGKIGYVAQSPYLINGTLAENVAFSRWGETIDRERVLECCRLAVLDFVDELENGIDTVLGERGTRLSGGQAQRVAIARALYSEPDLIIFDEATSALDMKNEKAIHETILSLRDTVTMVIIAHRLTSVEGCDSIVWMESGRVRVAGEAEAVLAAYCQVLAVGTI